MTDTGIQPGTLNTTGALVAIIMVCLLGFALWALVFILVPDANQNVLLVLVGALATNVTSIVSFFFGGSLGSRQKDSTIAQQASTAGKVQDSMQKTPDVTLQPGDAVKVAAQDEK